MYLELIFVCGVRKGSIFILARQKSVYPFDPAPCVEKTVLSPLSCSEYLVFCWAR